MKTTAMIPQLLAAFTAEIQHLKGAPATPANKAEGREIIERYTGRLQLLDLGLNQQAARDILADAYRAIGLKTMADLEAERPSDFRNN